VLSGYARVHVLMCLVDVLVCMCLVDELELMRRVDVLMCLSACAW